MEGTVHNSGLGLAAEEPVREPPPRRDGHGRQLVPGRRRVADGENPLDRRFLLLVHLHEAPRIRLHARVLQLQKIRRRRATGGEQHAVHPLDPRAIGKAHCLQAGALVEVDSGRGGARVQRRAVRFHVGHERLDDEVIETSTEDGVAAESEVGLGAEAVQDAGHFHLPAATVWRRTTAGEMVGQTVLYSRRCSQRR